MFTSSLFWTPSTNFQQIAAKSLDKFQSTKLPAAMDELLSDLCPFATRLYGTYVSTAVL